MSIKKYSMLAIKAGVGLFPKSVRNFAKKSAALNDLYSRSLQQSGLFYGFPSRKKLLALYNHTLTRQRKLIDSELLTRKTLHHALSVALIGADAKAIMRTLHSLESQLDRIDCVYVQIDATEKLSCEMRSKLVFIEGLNDPALQQLDSPLLILNCGDEIHSHALNYLCKQPLKDIVYVDTDEKKSVSSFENARLLPNWNPDYQLSNAYVETGLVVGKKWRSTLTGTKATTIAGLICELWLQHRAIPIEHIPLSLVHFVSNKIRQKHQLEEIATLIKSEQAVAVTDTNKLINTLQWPMLNKPLVSLIIPTKNAKELVKACIDSILNKTTYQNYEIILVDNNSDEPESLAYFEELHRHVQIRVLKYPHPFNYSAINNFAANYAKGQVIGLINNDIEVITPDWLEYMVGHAIRNDIGCVGAKLLYSDGRVQHAGVVMGYGGGAGHAHKYFPRYHAGYMNRLIATQNYSAVTAACLFVKKSLYHSVEGLNEKDLQVAFNDVDFCLKVASTGVRNLYCAEAELYHHESVSRGLDTTPEKLARFNRELGYLQSNWGRFIEHDPAYNPNLTLVAENFGIKNPKEF